MLNDSRSPSERGFTIAELMISIGIIAVLGTVMMRAFIGGTRLNVQQSAQGEVQSSGRIALERFINDTRAGFAVVTQVTHPTSGRVYTTTAAADNNATLEDDRFTVVLAMPAIDAGTGEILFDANTRAVAFDAVVWRVVYVGEGASEGIGWKASDYRWQLVRTVIPMVWFTDRANTSVDRANNRLTYNGATYTMRRQEENLSDASWDALTAATRDLMLDVPQAAGFVTFKNSFGALIGGSPTTVSTGLPGGIVGNPPPDHTAYVSGTVLPEDLAGNAMPVTDVALMDMKLGLLRREAAMEDSTIRNEMEMLSATDVRLRNKRDWN